MIALSTPVPPRSARDPYLDNVRYWVMLLVVIGHSITELVVMDSARGVYTWIYLFHMPLFVLVSGFLARGYHDDHRHVRRLVTTLIVPYLLVESSMQVLTRHWDGTPTHLMILSPQWIGWFLAALLIWRLTTPIWRVLKYPVTTSIVISLTAGLIEIPNVLALPKVLGFLPFYVIGLQLDRDAFRRLQSARVRIGAAAVIVTTLGLCLLYAHPLTQQWSSQWLLYKQRYDEDPLSVGPVEGIITRAVLLVIALVLTAAVLSLVPRRRSWTTPLGERTLYAYLLHGYVILLLDRQFHLWDHLEPYGAWAVAGCMIVAAVLATALMTRPVQVAFRPLFEPRLDWLFRPAPPTDTPQAQPRSTQRSDSDRTVLRH